MQVVFGFSGGLQEDLERYHGVMRVARAEGWHVLGVHEQFERSLMRLVDTGAVDGVIGDFISEAWLGDLPQRLPLVHVGAAGFSAGVAAVTFDPLAMGRASARHMAEMGYGTCRVYEVPGQPLSSAFYEGVMPGGDVDDLKVRGYEGLQSLLAEVVEPVGLMCPSDFQARQVIQAVKRAGMAIPEQLGVLGIGDRFWDRIAAERGISSIPLPHEALGKRAADLLLSLMKGGEPRRVLVAPGEVIARETTLRESHPRALVVRVEAEFQQRLAEAPDLEDLARRVGMSRRAFERTFRDQSGTTPYQYLLQMRLAESQRLLRETQWTISRIGEQVGYPEPPRFSAFFKRLSGMSPSQWANERVATKRDGD